MKFEIRVRNTGNRHSHHSRSLWSTELRAWPRHRSQYILLKGGRKKLLLPIVPCKDSPSSVPPGLWEPNATLFLWLLSSSPAKVVDLSSTFLRPPDRLGTSHSSPCPVTMCPRGRQSSSTPGTQEPGSCPSPQYLVISSTWWYRTCSKYLKNEGMKRTDNECMNKQKQSWNECGSGDQNPSCPAPEVSRNVAYLYMLTSSTSGYQKCWMVR